MKQSLLPLSASTLERNVERVTATADALPAETIGDLWNPDECPENLLPWLAWALSVDHWDTTWTENSKRQAIKDSIFVHRKKGTRGAIDRALNALALRVDIKEWFETNGEPYTFELTALANQLFTANEEGDPPENEVLLDKKFFDIVRRTIDEVKPVRSHYKFQVSANFSNAAGIGSNISGGSVVVERAQIAPQTIIRQSNLGLASPFINASFIRLRMEAN